MITRDKLSELFVEGLPSLRFSRPSLSAELSEWRLCFAQHFVEIKKSGPASESHIAYLLLERLFVDGDEDVRQEAQLLLNAVVDEAHRAGLLGNGLRIGFGPETLLALDSTAPAVPHLEVVSAAADVPSFWGTVGLIVGFLSWVPIVILQILNIDNLYLSAASWITAALGLGFGIHHGLRKKV